MKKLLFAVVASCLVTAFATYAYTRYRLERPELGERVVAGTLRSSVLEEERPFLVHLPESYARSPQRQYPTIYVLDGTSQDLPTARAADLMARIGTIPELIVVGIPNVGRGGRERNYTPPGLPIDDAKRTGPRGEGDRFLAFLGQELIPRIERDYRTSRPRLLAGNSRGGLFVVYALIDEPALFDAWLAFSPALFRDDDAIVVALDEALATRPEASGFLYVSLGDGENAKMNGSFAHLRAVLERRARPPFRWHAAITPGAVHRDNAFLSTPLALRDLFATGEPCGE